MSDLLYKVNKSKEDIDLLLIRHKNLVYYMLSRMGQLANQDAESYAWEALWDALNTFDVYSTTAFSTYACKLLKNAINGVLRKQQLEEQHKCAVVEYTIHMTLTCTVEPDNAAYVSKIDKLFEEYVLEKSGLVKNVLLAWYSSKFEAQVVDIAKMCGCSPSYASRVQRDFRAFVSSKLKEL